MLKIFFVTVILISDYIACENSACFKFSLVDNDNVTKVSKCPSICCYNYEVDCSRIPSLSYSGQRLNFCNKWTSILSVVLIKSRVFKCLYCFKNVDCKQRKILDVSAVVNVVV